MTAQLSIIIPTLNAQSDLPGCLSALFEGLHAGLIRELLISDGGSDDATVVIAEAAGAVLLDGPASRGGQLARAVAQSRGEWLLILHADTQLAPGWSEHVAEHLAQSQRPAYFRLAFRARGFAPAFVAGWANLRARLFALPYGDQGLLVPRTVYEAAGGYRDLPLMEDVALIRALGRPLTMLPSEAATCARRYQRSGWLRRGTRNLWTLARYFTGGDPRALADSYRR